MMSSCLSVDLSVVGAVLVNNKYRLCREVNLETHRLVCEVTTEEEERKKRYLISGGGCYSPTLTCPPGDIKTCMPIMTINSMHYQCFCH